MSVVSPVTNINTSQTMSQCEDLSYTLIGDWGAKRTQKVTFSKTDDGYTFLTDEIISNIKSKYV